LNKTLDPFNPHRQTWRRGILYGDTGRSEMKSRARRVRLVAALAAVAMLVLLSQRSHAWWSGGHKLLTLAAAAKMPADVPEFFRKAGEELAEMATEPDNWKDPATPHLRITERPEHFIDLEWLEDKPLPRERIELMKLLSGKGEDPTRAGFLPYAIQEGYERLLLAFREYRKRPDAPAVQHRVLMYAGWLAHYSEDAGMPLHTTKFYDGRPGPEKEVVQKGIHAKIDAYPEKHGLTAEAIAEGLAVEQADEAWLLVLKTIGEANKRVDACYQLDTQGAFDTAPEKGRQLMLECTRAGVKLTADLWYSAWVNSGKESKEPAKRGE